MNYAEAAKIRKTSFGNLYADRVIQGQNPSARSVVSDKLAARAIGLKQTFGLMNIAKVLTLGSNWAPALVGSIVGASKSDIRHVTGRKAVQERQLRPNPVGSSDMSPVNDVLEKMINFMQTSDMKSSEELETLQTYEMLQQKLRVDRHTEVMTILVNATAKKRRAEKQMKAEAQKREQRERDKKAMGEKVPEAPTKPSAPTTKPTTQAPPTPKPTTQAPTTPAPGPAPAPAPSAPTAPIPKPSASPVRPAITGAAKTAAKVGISAIGVFAATDIFAMNMFPYAKIASQKLGGKVPPEAILAQWAGESGGGKALPAPFNYAGIKAGPNDKKGDYVLTEERYTPAQIKKAQQKGETLHKVLGPKDTITKDGRKVTVDEWYGKGSIAKAKSEGKKWVQIRTYFSKYDSPEEFVEGYVKTLSKDRYKKAREATDAKTFGLEVAKAGYATASPQKYSEKVSSYAGSLENLSKDNADMKKELSQGSGATVVVIENTLNAKQSTVNTGSVPQNNINPRLRR